MRGFIDLIVVSRSEIALSALSPVTSCQNVRPIKEDYYPPGIPFDASLVERASECQVIMSIEDLPKVATFAVSGQEFDSVPAFDHFGRHVREPSQMPVHGLNSLSFALVTDK